MVVTDIVPTKGKSTCLFYYSLKKKVDLLDSINLHFYKWEGTCM